MNEVNIVNVIRSILQLRENGAQKMSPVESLHSFTNINAMISYLHHASPVLVQGIP
jgi:hypothetical protein